MTAQQTELRDREGELNNFWFSAKQRQVFDEGHHCYVTIDGEEMEYTECCPIDEKYAGYKPNWDDAVLLGQAPMNAVRVVGGFWA